VQKKGKKHNQLIQTIPLLYIVKGTIPFYLKHSDTWSGNRSSSTVKVGIEKVKQNKFISWFVVLTHHPKLLPVLYITQLRTSAPSAIQGYIYTKCNIYIYVDICRYIYIYRTAHLF
jgi:hypothetical protein